MAANKDTSQWILQVWISFIIALGAATVGVYKLPLEGWAKWFMIFAIFATLSSSFTLSKTLRDNKDKQQDTQQWVLQVWFSFVVCLIFSFGGLWSLEADFWIKAYIGVSFLFALSSTFTLAKTVRDNQESILPKLPKAFQSPDKNTEH